MKKIIFPILFALVSFACSAQVIGIKFPSAKGFIVKPAITIVTDSLTISNIHDNGTNVTVDVTFFPKGQPNSIAQNTMSIILWEGTDYITNKDWTKSTLKNALKTILQNQ